MAIALVCGLLAVILVCPVSLADGALDPGYGTGGIVTTDWFGSLDSAHGVAVTLGGQAIVVGTTDTRAMGSGPDFGVAKYLDDGTLDPSFGTGGRFSFGVPDFADDADAVAIQSDGRIVVAGNSSRDAITNMTVARLASGGSLDSTFGAGGVMTVSHTSGVMRGRDLALQPDGKIVVVGETSGPADADFTVVRLNVDGSLDSSFGAGGIVTTTFASPSADVGRAVALQSDGKIVVAGSTTAVGRSRYAMARYKVDGSLDATFGDDGLVITALSAIHDAGNTIAIQSDGKLVVAGSSVESGATPGFSMARYDTNGDLDAGFGTGGTVISGLSTEASEAAKVLVQGDGKILLAGYLNLSLLDSAFAVTRYGPDGAREMDFGTGGLLSTDLTPAFDWVYDAALQPDGKLLVVGGANALGPASDYAVVRYAVGAPAAQAFVANVPLVMSGM